MKDGKWSMLRWNRQQKEDYVSSYRYHQYKYLINLKIIIPKRIQNHLQLLSATCPTLFVKTDTRIRALPHSKVETTINYP